MIDAFARADAGVVAAAGAVMVFAVIFALTRGHRGDGLERLADWARMRGLAYLPPAADDEVATFAGEIEGLPVRVEVTRVAVRLGRDVPTRLTTVTVGEGAGAAVCVLQPAEWTMDREGKAAGERVSTGDEAFDARWAVRVAGGDAAGGNAAADPNANADVGAAERLVSPLLRARLLEVSAEGLILEVAAGAVAVVMPGVCAEAAELDRRVAIAGALVRVLA